MRHQHQRARKDTGAIITSSLYPIRKETEFVVSPFRQPLEENRSSDNAHTARARILTVANYWLLTCLIAVSPTLVLGQTSQPTPAPRSAPVEAKEVEREKTARQAPDPSPDRMEAEAAAGEAERVHLGVAPPPGKDPQRFLVFIGITGTILTVVVIVYACIAAVGRVLETRRTREFEAAAQELGLAFQPDGSSAFELELSSFPLLDIGRARELKNLVTADTSDVRVSIFDYKYVTGHGKSKRTRCQTVIAVQSPELRTPTFHLRPEGLLDAVGSLLGRQDIDFDDHPEFSKTFVLKSETEDETRKFFDQSMLDFFASRRGITFETTSGVFLYYRNWRRVPPEVGALREFFDEGLNAFRVVRDRMSRN